MQKYIYIWNSATCSCKNGKYLTSIIDNSVIRCDEIINAVSPNVPTTMSTNFQKKKVRYKMNFSILLTVLLVLLLLFIIAVICYHDAKHESKQKNVFLC